MHVEASAFLHDDAWRMLQARPEHCHLPAAKQRLRLRRVPMRRRAPRLARPGAPLPAVAHPGVTEAHRAADTASWARSCVLKSRSAQAALATWPRLAESVVRMSLRVRLRGSLPVAARLPVTVTVAVTS